MNSNTALLGSNVVYLNSTVTMTLNFVDQNNNPVNLTGATVSFSIQQINTPSSISTVVPVIVAPTSGQCIVTLTSTNLSQVGEYQYQASVTLPAGTYLSSIGNLFVNSSIIG